MQDCSHFPASIRLEKQVEKVTPLYDDSYYHYDEPIARNGDSERRRLRAARSGERALRAGRRSRVT